MASALPAKDESVQVSGSILEAEHEFPLEPATHPAGGSAGPFVKLAHVCTSECRHSPTRIAHQTELKEKLEEQLALQEARRSRKQYVASKVGLPPTPDAPPDGQRVSSHHLPSGQYQPAALHEKVERNPKIPRLDPGLKAALEEQLLLQQKRRQKKSYVASKVGGPGTPAEPGTVAVHSGGNDEESSLNPLGGVPFHPESRMEKIVDVQLRDALEQQMALQQKRKGRREYVASKVGGLPTPDAPVVSGDSDEEFLQPNSLPGGRGDRRVVVDLNLKEALERQLSLQQKRRHQRGGYVASKVGGLPTPDAPPLAVEAGDSDEEFYQPNLLPVGGGDRRVVVDANLKEALEEQLSLQQKRRHQRGGYVASKVGGPDDPSAGAEAHPQSATLQLQHRPSRLMNQQLKAALEEQMALQNHRKGFKQYVASKVGGPETPPEALPHHPHHHSSSPSRPTDYFETAMDDVDPNDAVIRQEHFNRCHLVDVREKRDKILRARALAEVLQRQVESERQRRQPPPPTPPMPARNVFREEAERQSPPRQQQQPVNINQSTTPQPPLPMLSSQDAELDGGGVRGSDARSEERRQRARTSMEFSSQAPIDATTPPPMLNLNMGNFRSGTFLNKSVGRRARVGGVPGALSPTGAATYAGSPEPNASPPNVSQSLPLFPGGQFSTRPRAWFDLHEREQVELQRQKEVRAQTVQLKEAQLREIEERKRRREAQDARDRALDLEMEAKVRREAEQMQMEERRREEDAAQAAADVIEENRRTAEAQHHPATPLESQRGARSEDVPARSVRRRSSTATAEPPPPPGGAAQPTPAPHNQEWPMIEKPGTDFEPLDFHSGVVGALRDIKAELLAHRNVLSAIQDIPGGRPPAPVLPMTQWAPRPQVIGGELMATEEFLLRDTSDEILQRNQRRLGVLQRTGSDSNAILEAFLRRDAGGSSLRSLCGTRMGPGVHANVFAPPATSALTWKTRGVYQTSASF